jgi:acyl carrier protein
VAGEIYIAGQGVARGYLNLPELTAERFSDNPFEAGGKMYKSGDIGRWLPDGNIEFIGRRDEQVKIRGFRIELGEIQNTLQKYSSLDSALVLALPDKNGEKEIVAYITAKEKVAIADIRSYLGNTLPAYMIPAHFIQLAALPLTANGKLDRTRLPAPQNTGIGTEQEYVAPRNETEEKLLLRWQQVLGAGKISMNANFFEMGGHSLKAARLVSYINKDFNINCRLLILFNHPTIEALANEIEKIYWVNNRLFETGNTETISI